MPRDRSRSPVSRRKRSRSRSRDQHRGRHDRDYDRHRRDRDGRRDEDRHRRDRTPERRKEHRRRDSSEEYRDKDYRGGKPRRDDRSRTPESPDASQEAAVVDDKEVKEPQTEEEKQMVKMLGFFNFDSTKGKHVTGNNVYVANIQKKRKYRQYMNRRGGFNRKLDPIT